MNDTNAIEMIIEFAEAFNEDDDVGIRGETNAVGKMARAELERLQEKDEQIEDAIRQIKDWRDKAYPLDIFPEPDFTKVKELLGDNLLTLVSASNMRHVTTRICEILTSALKAGKNE